MNYSTSLQLTTLEYRHKYLIHSSPLKPPHSKDIVLKKLEVDRDETQTVLSVTEQELIIKVPQEPLYSNVLTSVVSQR